ncbi:MAG TPA: CinA family protein [Usitatibacteraceae bacterium]|nr:CinA family protein [Usitatibacteraceae bacterium]
MSANDLIGDAELIQLASDLGHALKARGLMLATAESCTGGGIAEAVTRIPGSSSWFDCAFVTYSYEAKTAMLGVHRDTLVDFGAVSEETAHQMAEGAITRSRAQAAVAVTGIAGPEGGLPDKPVGTVWFSWKVPKKPIISEVCHFSGDRVAVRRQTIAHALRGLLHNLN